MLPTPAGAGDETTLPSVQLGTTRVHAVTEAECVAHVLAQLEAGRGGWLLTLNLDHLRLIARVPDFAALCASATLVVADGMPLVWASWLQGTPLPERVAGSNLIWRLTAAAAQRGRSIFLLGGMPGTAERAAAVLRQRSPGLQIDGVLCPPLGFDRQRDEVARVCAAVCAAAPDIVYVALGKPKQERLICELRSRLPQTWFVGLGISFSFVSGTVRRAPLWMQRVGLEWLHRLTQEPERLARRYLVDGLPFAVRFLGESALRRLRRQT